MAKRKLEDQIFQCPFSTRLLSLVLTKGEGQFENLTPNFSIHHNFSLVISNWIGKTILNIYISRPFQWYNKCFIWTTFCTWTFLSNIWEVVPVVKLFQVAPWGNLIHLSLGGSCSLGELSPFFPKRSCSFK